MQIANSKIIVDLLTGMKSYNAKGLSQEELAIKLNVVRQIVSKWENGLSVPDSDMLITYKKR